MKIDVVNILALACLAGTAGAWTVTTTTTTATTSRTTLSAAAREEEENRTNAASSLTSRRSALIRSLSVAAPFLLLSSPPSANALVKGNAPPPKKSKTAADERKCTNVEECQAMAEQREQELREKEMAGPPPKVTSTGVRYRDVIEADANGGAQVGDGDTVQLYYKVLKLGKRSYDGLSGEGTVVFSRGYGLEDDETKPGSKFFETTIGNVANIPALNEAVVGMRIGDVRRFAVMPQKGWRKPTAACDGGPGGSGSGGDLRTDYVVVPTATMVDQEVCFDQTKQPFPSTYAQQRRMAQRFDQSLIMEVQVANIVGK